MPDIHLSADHLEGLDSLEAVQALFARLGYTQHAPVDPTTFASPAVRADLLQVDQCWRDSFHRVLLCVYPTVTQQRVNALAAEFRDVGGRQLVVLAARDFRRLDFVLFDRTPAGLVPRRLVVRRGLDQTPRQAVLLRALRRFTYTEPDPLAQWEKLRSAFTSAEWSEQYFDNRGLFSDYFLAGPLREMPEWTTAAAQAGALRKLHTKMTEVREALLAARAPAPDAPVAPDAALLRHTLFTPLAAQLGYLVEPVAPTSPDARQPDYTLWHPAADHPLAIALVYGWDRPLDGPAPYDPADDPRAAENPGAAVVSALANYTYQDAAGTAHPVPWAIVTNGKHWRLYSTLAASQATDFLQLDLEEAIAATTPTGQPDPTILHYFALLFGASSLLPTAGQAEPPKTFLARLVALGRTYAQELGDRLKDRIFADIFRLLAEGFIADQAAAGAPAHTPAQLRTVFDGTLTLLYRLLFLLYAESRNLLPSQEAGAYWDASLERLKAEVAAAAGTDAAARDAGLRRAYAADRHELWGRLHTLFTTVDRGSAELNVPAYNGGLFAAGDSPALSAREQEVAAFLDRWRVDDRRLAQALDRLARDPNPKSRTQALEPIDFRSLGVRQLGSIYEGLLEFQLQIAPERLAVRAKDETYIPLAAAQRDKVKLKPQAGSGPAQDWAVETGSVYLTNSTLERKASGSYYTPEAIVEYIVEHTVGPGLTAHLASLEEDLRRARAGAPARTAAAPLSAAEQHLVERIFAFRVLDPAMGSGHFLVAAVDFIADRLIDFLNGYPHNPVERMLAATRATIIAAAQAGGVTIDPARLSAINLLKRHVLKACLYGVDLNPMAVELAKVSLWLHCFTLGAPLSFLGHHLKVGNSLVGETALGTVVQEGSPRWAELEQAIGEYLRVSRQADATSAEAAASRQTFTRAEARLAALRARANAQTARWWLGWSTQDVADAQGLNRAAASSPHPKSVEAQQLAAAQTFFHWPLEFPEVYFEPTTNGRYQQRANPGFEAVVGNPPWERTRLEVDQFFALRSAAVMAAATKAQRDKAIKALQTIDPPLWAEYQETQRAAAGFAKYVKTSGRYQLMRQTDTNLYQLFTEHAWNLAAATGRFGLLVPSGIAVEYGSRKFFGALVDRGAVAQVLDFENRRGIFPEVHRMFKFTIFIGAGPAARVERIPCAFFLHSLDDLDAEGKVVYLDAADIQLLNPNTRTLPVLRNQRDVDLLRAIYRRLPILLADERGQGEVPDNPWGVRYARQFDMSLARNDFVETEDLLGRGARRTPDGAFELGAQRWLRLYEGKMIEQFDHRFARVVGNVGGASLIGDSAPSTPAEHADPSYLPDGRYWVDLAVAMAKRGAERDSYTVAFRDIASVTNNRTAIAAITPNVAHGNTAPLFYVSAAVHACFLVAWLNSMPNDFVVRRKLSSNHLNFFYLKQLPIPSPAQVAALGAGGDTLAWVAERVLELSYTAWDLQPLARDLGYEGPPFAWSEERRLHLRTQLDALFAHLYGLSADDLDYIAGTFWIVEENETKAWGSYRTRALQQAYHQAYAAGDWGHWAG